MFKKITIIGLGLIGSSIARAIKKKNLCKNLIAHDKSESVINTDLKNKITICFKSILTYYIIMIKKYFI